MKKLSVVLLVVVLLAGGLYAVQANAGEGGDTVAKVDKQTTVQNTDQKGDQTAKCSRHDDCPADCGHTGKCTSDCPHFTDDDNDGQCDTHGKCHTNDKHEGCPGHDATTKQDCPGHAKGGCGKH